MQDFNETSTNSIDIVINADDYGYFRCVSNGILSLAKQNAISATAVMANGPNFIELAGLLQDVPNIDLGAHLNLTYGSPLSSECKRYFVSNGGCFKNKINTAIMALNGSLPIRTIKNEWRFQIDTILSAGLNITFLNSHEHIHILPPIANIMDELSIEYGIKLVRHPLPDWHAKPLSFSIIVRNLLIQIANLSNTTLKKDQETIVLGIGASGQLTFKYLEHCFKNLSSGKHYELMCHPGFFDPNEISDQYLLKFHSWEKETSLLISQSFKDLLSKYNIKLKKFSDLGFDI